MPSRSTSAASTPMEKAEVWRSARSGAARKRTAPPGTVSLTQNRSGRRPVVRGVEVEIPIPVGIGSGQTGPGMPGIEDRSDAEGPLPLVPPDVGPLPNRVQHRIQISISVEVGEQDPGPIESPYDGGKALGLGLELPSAEVLEEGRLARRSREQKIGLMVPGDIPEGDT